MSLVPVILGENDSRTPMKDHPRASVSHPACCISCYIIGFMCCRLSSLLVVKLLSRLISWITLSKAVGSRAETNPQATQRQKKGGKRKKQSLCTGCTVSSVADSYWREDLEELQARENNGMCPKFRFISGCDKKEKLCSTTLCCVKPNKHTDKAQCQCKLYQRHSSSTYMERTQHKLATLAFFVPVISVIAG